MKEQRGTLARVWRVHREAEVGLPEPAGLGPGGLGFMCGKGRGWELASFKPGR